MSDKIAKFEKAGMAKRLWAAIMDATIFVFTYFLLAIWVFTPIANAAFKYDEKNDLGNQYRFASHLLVNQKRNDDGDLIVVEMKDTTGLRSDYVSVPLYSYKSEDPNFYIKRVYYYYHNYKTNTDIELPLKNETRTFDPIEDHFVSPEYNQEIDGVLPVNLYTNDWFSKNVLEIEKEDSYFKIDSSKEDYLESIVLKDENKKSEALEFLRSTAVGNATTDFTSSKYYTDINNSIYAIQVFIFLPPFAVAYMAFYMLIPLLMKDGETLGKKVCHLSVISFNGYAAKKRQIVFRQLLLFIVMFVAAFAIGIGITSFAILGLVTAVLFGLTLLSKQKRSLHDYAAYTIVIDSIHSTWFKNEADEKRHEQELEDNMSKYKKVIINNENVIQIGSKIVDEKLKKELEEEKK